MRVRSQPETVLWPAGTRSHVTSWAGRQQTNSMLKQHSDEGSIVEETAEEEVTNNDPLVD